MTMMSTTHPPTHPPTHTQSVAQLRKELSIHKEDILAKDAAIGDKETRIYDLKLKVGVILYLNPNKNFYYNKYPHT